MTQFEKGALFALQVLKEVVTKRDVALKAAEQASTDAGDRDLYQVLGGVRNVSHGIRSEFESKLLPQLRAAQAEPSPDARDHLGQELQSILRLSAKRNRADTKGGLNGDLDSIEAAVQRAIELQETL